MTVEVLPRTLLAVTISVALDSEPHQHVEERDEEPHSDQRDPGAQDGVAAAGEDQHDPGDDDRTRQHEPHGEHGRADWTSILGHSRPPTSRLA